MKIEFANPFAVEGRWFKGNLHTHSTNSDGALDAQELIRRYRSSGYDFLAITDHNRFTQVEDDLRGEILLIPGEEINVGSGEVGTAFHLVLIGIREHCSERSSPQAVIDRAREQGGEVILCHPYWSQLCINDMLSIDGYIGVEVFNSTCHYSIGKGFSQIHWDDLLARGKRLWGFAVDDAHHHTSDHRPTDVCNAWISVKCPELTLDSIMKAIRSGHFYSSTGPQILDIRIEEDTIYVETSPVRHITFISMGGRGERWTPIGREFITQAHHRVRSGERFIRIECEDLEGGWAWSNPIFIAE
jgi:hypothetical protein